MKVIFFGLGSIGQRHARLLRTRGGCEIFAVRTGQGDAPDPDFPVKVLAGWPQVEAVQPEVAFITNPTAAHIPTAIECARRGMALFIEKPLGHNTEGLEELIQLVRQKNLPTYVAYVLRFHPVILKLQEMLRKEPALHMHVQATSFLPDWRPGRDHLKSYSASRSLGGGALGDLSHDLDYVRFLLGEIQTMTGQCRRLSTVTLDADDCADMVIKAVKGVANVHLSFLSHRNQRLIKVSLPHRMLVADLLENTIEEFRHDRSVSKEHLPIERDELFGRQMDYFWQERHNPAMMNNVSEAAVLFRQMCTFKHTYEKP